MGSIYAQEIANQIAMQGEPVRLIGWSIGALIALEIAAEWPERVCGVVLINGTARFTATEGDSAGTPIEQLQKLLAAIASPDQCERALTRFIIQSALPHRMDRSTLKNRVVMANALGTEGLVDGLHYLRDTDVRALVDRITQPVLLLHGSEDVVIPPGAAHWLANHLPQAKLHIEQGMGHDWPLRDPERIVDLCDL